MAAATSGVVSQWYAEEGWGVIDASETPGGCWVHYSAVLMEGYRSLEAGQPMTLEWERRRQDGFAYVATRVWPAGDTPYEPKPERNAAEPSTGYRSRLTIRLRRPR